MCRKMNAASIAMIFILLSLLCIQGCTEEDTPVPAPKTVPHEHRWGIYRLDITSQDVELIYSSAEEIFTSAPRLNSQGSRLAFAQKTGGTGKEAMEIYTIGIDGEILQRLTNNTWWDLYPVWSPDDTRIAFLSMRDKDLDIYIMDASGENDEKFYDSGDNDADIDWGGGTIVFTSEFAIWKINDDGTQPEQVTNLEGKGEWGTANLPKGDYDPRLSPDNRKIVFERLENTAIPHGGYNIFMVNTDGSGEIKLTDNGYSQGLADWSHSGDELVYIVSAIGDEGRYDIYLMNTDGSNNRNITPEYFPANFLCHSATFSADDASVYFIGEWWEKG